MKRLSLVIILLSAGCIDPIALKVGQGGSLMVDGWITDQPGPYLVKLARSITYDNSLPLKVYSLYESRAVVKIIDSNGQQYSLTEITPGTYQTPPSLQGTVGMSYQVVIRTSDGKNYESTPEQILPVPPIADIKYEFLVYDVLFFNTNGTARTQRMEGFPVKVVVQDPADSENYYRWQVDGIFEYFTIILDPSLRQCWAPLTRLEPNLEIAEDLYFNGQSYEQQLTIINYTRPTKFLVKVRQQSVTKTAYQYLKKVSAQQNSTGTLFDPPPQPIPSNVHNISDPEESVVGYFGVSGVAKLQTLIDRNKASNYVFPGRNIPIAAGDCRTFEPNATNIKPDGF